MMTWLAGLLACIWVFKTDRSDLSLMFWDPDGVTDAIELSWIEWVLFLSWPIWAAAVIGVLREGIRVIFKKSTSPRTARVARDGPPTANLMRVLGWPHLVAIFEAVSLREKEKALRRRERALRGVNNADQPGAGRESEPQGLRAGVRARVPQDADDFESVCAEWVTRCGIDVERTAKGPDGGVDIIGTDFIGQCKFHPAGKVGAPDVQKLVGAAVMKRKSTKAFFHYGPGYTPAAVEAARLTGVQLWRFDPTAPQTFRQVTE